MERSVHITAEELVAARNAITESTTEEFVKKADVKDLTGHTSNKAIHITNAERSTWNNKADASKVYGKTDVDNLLSEAAASVASRLAKKADLVDGVVPASQLPSFVDDVLEYASSASFPNTGEAGKIYVALDTNLTYRWGGSKYVEISKSLALGETEETAYAGDKGKRLAIDLQSHLRDMENPHEVTADQLKLATVATSGSYDDLEDQPKIPEKLSDLEQDIDYLTANDVGYTDDVVYKTIKDIEVAFSKYYVTQLGDPNTHAYCYVIDTNGVTAIINGLAPVSEPVFTAWRDGTCVKVGKDAKVAEKDADGASVVSATALGANSYTATSGSLAVAQTPDLILLNSKAIDSGASAKTLRDYMDEAAQRYYQFKTLDSNVVVAENAMLYDLTLTAEQATAGMTITLPYSKNHTQDFIIRLDATAGATQITSITQAADDGTALSFDWPRGDMTATGALAADTYYISFTQVGAYRWNVGYYRANI